MRCAAIAASTGKLCRRPAGPGEAFCSYHRSHAAPAPTAEEEPAVRPETAVGDLGIGEEIALLRRQIREAHRAGDAEAARRGIETLIKAVRVQHVVEGRSAESISAHLARVLDEIGAELGTPL